MLYSLRSAHTYIRNVNRFKDSTSCTDRNFNSRTVTVRVYWTTLENLGEQN